MFSLVNRLKKVSVIVNNQKLRYWYRCVKYKNSSDMYRRIPDVKCISHFFYIHSEGNLNRDKLIYNIKIDGGQSGFFAIYRSMLEYLYICDRFHFIPYISIQNSHYNDTDKDNVFDFFYLQYEGLSLNEVMRSYTIIDATPQHMYWGEKDYNLNDGYTINNKNIECLAQINHKYIIYKPEIRKQLNDEIKSLLGTKKTIGVHFRGNAFSIGLKDHPIQISIDDFYKYIENCLENGFDQIFLATDVYDIVKIMSDRYPGKVVCYNDVFRSTNGIDVHEQQNIRNNNGYQLAYEVLRDMNTLAACNALICGNSQVTIAARIEKESKGEKYEYLKIIDNGINKLNNISAIKRYNKNKKQLKR